MVILRAPVTLSRWGWLTDQRHFTVTISKTFHWFDKLWIKLTFDDSRMDNVVSKPNLKVFLPLVLITQVCIFTLQKVTVLPIMTDSVFHKIFLITCTGFRLRQRHQTAVLHLNLWKLPHGRYSPTKHHVSEVHLNGYASYFNKKIKFKQQIDLQE